jgi:hypothetical protein
MEMYVRSVAYLINVKGPCINKKDGGLFEARDPPE